MDTGDQVDDFERPDQDGTPQRLSSLLENGPIVLFFYPAAMTRGCTAEACHFRDLAAEFAAVGARPVGISADDVSKQQEFAKTNNLGFTLLSDPDRTVADAFGVRRRFGPIPVKRHTFIIGQDRRVIDVIQSEVNMEAHADKALATLASPRSSGMADEGGQ